MQAVVKHKMAIKIPPKLIIALFAVLILVLVFWTFFMQVLFGGPEVKAAKEIAEQIESACKEEGYNVTFDVYLPDSKGVPPDAYFFFIAIDDHKLILLGRRYGIEKNDLAAQFSDFLSCACANVVSFTLGGGKYSYGFSRFVCNCKEGIRQYKMFSLDTCMKNNIPICWKDDAGNSKCGKFQFESNEGKEDLLFTITRENNMVYLRYARQPVCGDGHCCPPEDDSNSQFYCKKDCEVLDPEKKCTWISTGE